MKLREFKAIRRIAQALNEYNYRVDHVKWREILNGWGCDLVVDHVNFIVEITKIGPKTRRDLGLLSPSFTSKKIYNLVFSLIQTQGKQTQDTVGIRKHIAGSRKVMYAVANAAYEKMMEENIDMLLFVAKREQSPTNFYSRAVAYSGMASFLRSKGTVGSIDLIYSQNLSVNIAYIGDLYDELSKLRDHLQKFHPRVDIKSAKNIKK